MYELPRNSKYHSEMMRRLNSQPSQGEFLYICTGGTLVFKHNVNHLQQNVDLGSCNQKKETKPGLGKCKRRLFKQNATRQTGSHAYSANPNT